VLTVNAWGTVRPSPTHDPTRGHRTARRPCRDHAFRIGPMGWRGSRSARRSWRPCVVVVGAGQRRFHGRQADDIVAVTKRVGERDHRAKIVSHYRHRSVDAQFLADEVAKVAGHGPFVVAITGLGGSTSAAVVGHDDLVACRHQRGHNLAPRVSGLRRTVDQPHRLRRPRRDAGESVADASPSGPVDPRAAAPRLHGFGAVCGTD
jgi:hypothetical protein